MTQPLTPPVADATSPSQHRREIKSFVRREGRTTPAQERALTQLLPKIGLEYHNNQLLNLESIFGNNHPVWLEIGFGMGHSLATLAQQMPNTNFIGIEVHRPGVGSLLNQLQQHNLTNVRVMCHDAIEVLKHMIPDHSLERVLLFFPDPWHKTKHHKRRIVQPAFLDLISTKLTHLGMFHSATDWQAYAEWMLATLNEHPSFVNTAENDSYALKPSYRAETKFERRGQKLGHGVWDLLFENQVNGV